jgi:hypothetical protein
MLFLLLNQLCLSLLFFLDFLGNLFDLLLEVGGLLIQSRSGLQRNIESVQHLIFRLGIQTKVLRILEGILKEFYNPTRRCQNLNFGLNWPG